MLRSANAITPAETSRAERSPRRGSMLIRGLMSFSMTASNSSCTTRCSRIKRQLGIYRMQQPTLCTSWAVSRSLHPSVLQPDPLVVMAPRSHIKLESVRHRHSAYLGARCTYPALPGVSVDARISGEREQGYQTEGSKRTGLVMHLECDIPRGVSLDVASLEVQLHVHGVFYGSIGVKGQRYGEATVPFTLKREIEKPKVQLAACVGPIWKQKGLFQTLEWRSHVARMGVERVYWYGREAEVREFVRDLNSIAGFDDEFR